MRAASDAPWQEHAARAPNQRDMRRLGIVLVLGLAATMFPAGAAPVCSSTPRPDPGNPFLTFQRQAFGFHDEELVLCSPGATSPTHLAARMWVPAACVERGSCPAVLIAHGFGFNKEITFGDMLNAAQRGMVVLSYDVRGQGMSGGQAMLFGPDDVADQAAILAWLHENVAPPKVGVYGISQGGGLAWIAAIFNCGAARAATLGSAISCEEDGRWVDAIAPLQGPVSLGSFSDGTCLLFAAEAVPYSRGNPAIVAEDARCVTRGLPIQGASRTRRSPSPGLIWPSGSCCRAWTASTCRRTSQRVSTIASCHRTRSCGCTKRLMRARITSKTYG